MNFFAYRLPRTSETVAFSSERTIDMASAKELTAQGFAVAPFEAGEYPAFIIPADEPLEELPENVPGGFVEFFPGESTSPESHQEEIGRIISRLKEIENECEFPPKTVAARVKLTEGFHSPRRIFEKLKDIPGHNFVFCFYTPETGLWMGTSPELLLKSDGQEYHTMALAGTRLAGEIGEWDTKNLAEQRTVTDFILTSLRNEGFEAEEGATGIKPTGVVEHLCTPIHARISETTNLPTIDDSISASDSSSDSDCKLTPLLRLASKLSPTPALSGFPREEALRLIRRSEGFERAYYGGYCGPVDSGGQGELYVNLRSGCFVPGWAALYAGGGITLGSDPAKEWEETDRKLRAILSTL